MKKLILFLIICLFIITAKIERYNLHQNKLDAKKQLFMQRSAEVAIEIPLAGNMTWDEMVGKE